MEWLKSRWFRYLNKTAFNIMVNCTFDVLRSAGAGVTKVAAKMS